MYFAKRRRRLLAPLLLSSLFTAALLGTWLSALSLLRAGTDDDDGIVARVKRGAPVPLRQRALLGFGAGCSRYLLISADSLRT